MDILKEKYKLKYGKYYKWKFNNGKVINVPLEVKAFPGIDHGSYLCPKINEDLSVNFLVAELNTPEVFGYTFDSYVGFFCHKKGKNYYLNIN